jgi:hypothetical protein
MANRRFEKRPAHKKLTTPVDLCGRDHLIFDMIDPTRGQSARNGFGLFLNIEKATVCET